MLNKLFGVLKECLYIALTYIVYILLIIPYTVLDMLGKKPSIDDIKIIHED